MTVSKPPPPDLCDGLTPKECADAVSGGQKRSVVEVIDDFEHEVVSAQAWHKSSPGRTERPPKLAECNLAMLQELMDVILRLRDAEDSR